MTSRTLSKEKQLFLSILSHQVEESQFPKCFVGFSHECIKMYFNEFHWRVVGTKRTGSTFRPIFLGLYWFSNFHSIQNTELICLAKDLLSDTVKSCLWDACCSSQGIPKAPKSAWISSPSSLNSAGSLDHISRDAPWKGMERVMSRQLCGKQEKFRVEEFSTSPFIDVPA